MAQQTSPTVEPTPPALQQGLGTTGLRNGAVSTFFRGDQMAAGTPNCRQSSANMVQPTWRPCGTFGVI